MARALRLAERGRYTADPNPCVGCVIVRDNQVVGEGWHERAGGDHAEIVALRQAGPSAAGATLYVTLEPCCYRGRTPPCTVALIAAKPKRVVAAMHDPNPKVAAGGIAALREAEIEVDVGLLADQALQLNRGFAHRMKSGRPWVTIKLAASLDGRTAMASGESKWITGNAARSDVQRLRAHSSAIVTGIGTVLADDPRLTVRLEGVSRQPVRVVVDSRLRVPDSAKLWTQGGQVIVATAVTDTAKFTRLQHHGAAVISLPSPQGGVDLTALLQHLGQREVNELLVEAGPILAGALMQSGVADDVVLYLAPRLLGDDAHGMFQMPGLTRLADSCELQVDDVRTLGGDVRIRARVLRNSETRDGGDP